jgi:hypothetical protein
LLSRKSGNDLLKTENLNREYYRTNEFHSYNWDKKKGGKKLDHRFSSGKDIHLKNYQHTNPKK